MAAGPARPGDLDLELERWQLVLFREGPRREELQARDPRRVAELEEAHLRAAMAALRAGQLLAAGSVAPRPGEEPPPVTGLAFFRTPPEETRRILDADPAAKAGLLTTTIVEFTCPKGALAFPLAAAPAPLQIPTDERP
jgi:hypothetical protein